MSDTAHRRLLDMLAGWEKYVAACTDADTPPSPDPSPEEYHGEWERLFDLYQEAGRITSCPTDDRIRDFVVDRVLPMILEGSVPLRSIEK